MESVERVAVIGAGTIGASWTAFFLSRGMQVVANDPDPAAEDFLNRYLAEAWKPLAKITDVKNPPWSKLQFTSDIQAAVSKAQYIQESGPENYEIKTELISTIDRYSDEMTIIGSSSSGLLMSRLQERCTHPERCIIAHPFNPPHLIPLIEIVGGKLTSERTLERAITMFKHWGKAPIRLKREIPGHIANRLQAALWREAVHLVAEGVTTVEDVDAAVIHGPGLRWAIMGPNMTFHLGGGEGGIKHFLEHLLGPIETWWDDLGKPVMTKELQEMIVAGVSRVAAGASVKQLADQRDAALVALMSKLK